MCVLYRGVGIIPMHYLDGNMNLYIVEEGSLGVVNQSDSDNESMRKNICIMLSQNDIAGVLHSADLIGYAW